MLLCVAHSGGVGGRKYLYPHTHIAIGKREKRDFHSYVHTHNFMCAVHARTPEEKKGGKAARSFCRRRGKSSCFIKSICQLLKERMCIYVCV